MKDTYIDVCLVVGPVQEKNPTQDHVYFLRALPRRGLGIRLLAAKSIPFAFGRR